MVNKSYISNLEENFDLNPKLATSATKLELKTEQVKATVSFKLILW